MPDLWTEIGEANAAWMSAYAEGRLEDLALAYTEDAESLAPDAQPLVGREAIRAFWESARSGRMARLGLETRDLESVGDTAIEIGESVQMDADGSAFGRFHYLVVWKRHDGRWLVHREIWNAAPG